MTRTVARSGVMALLALIACAVAEAPASAHVTVQPGTAEQGGFTVLAFRVPTERDDASMTKLEVAFPADQPLAFVSVVALRRRSESADLRGRTPADRADSSV